MNELMRHRLEQLCADLRRELDQLQELVLICEGRSGEHVALERALLQHSLSDRKRRLAILERLQGVYEACEGKL